MQPGDSHATYPQYTVNHKIFGSDYATANLYWSDRGGVLMEKIDYMTPAHVLQTKPLREA